MDPWIDEPRGSKKTHCKRAVCECDRGLAYRLRDHENSWDLKFHRRWWSPGFDYKECQVNPNRMNKKPNYSGNNGLGRPDKNILSEKKCCGNYQDNGLRFPFETLGGYRECCGSKTYDTQTKQCCSAEDSDVKSRGACQ